MATHPFFWVDAFTDERFAGNPCAIVLDTEDLDAGTMQTIAREMNLSETSFVRRSRVADVAARYFTPSEEIPLAGHPTIATTRALLEAGRLPEPSGGHVSFSLELRDGPISVGVDVRELSRPLITMTQRRPAFGRTYAPDVVMPVFGLSPGDLIDGVPIQTVSTGTPQLMVPLRSHDALGRARLDVERYEALRSAGDFFSPHTFCLGGFTAAGDTAARHLGAPPDVLEDPFTGSATGGMAAFLWHHGLIDQPRFTAEQGHPMGRPGLAHVEVVGPREAIETVRVGGPATILVRGELTL